MGKPSKKGLSATLVTNNLAHFQRVAGLSVTRWP